MKVTRLIVDNDFEWKSHASYVTLVGCIGVCNASLESVYCATKILVAWLHILVFPIDFVGQS